MPHFLGSIFGSGERIKICHTRASFIFQTNLWMMLFIELCFCGSILLCVATLIDTCFLRCLDVIALYDAKMLHPSPPNTSS